MRTVVMPGGPMRSLRREWERIDGSLSAIWHYASRSNAFRPEVSGVPAIGSVGTLQRGSI